MQDKSVNPLLSPSKVKTSEIQPDHKSSEANRSESKKKSRDFVL